MPYRLESKSPAIFDAEGNPVKWVTHVETLFKSKQEVKDYLAKENNRKLLFRRITVAGGQDVATFIL